MQRSKIEWCDYTVNPVKGYCPMACPYCYARRMYDRFKWDKTIRYDDSWWYKLNKIKPSRIFVGSTFELFGEWMEGLWMGCNPMERIMEICSLYWQHTFIFLTKCPQNLLKFRPFPNNVWLGASVTRTEEVIERSYYLGEIPEVKVKFLSYEPLRGHAMLWLDASWIIIGAETGNRKGKPPLAEVHEWVSRLGEQAYKAGIPIFQKNNLRLANPRQEFPK